MAATLSALGEGLGEREAAVTREITKKFEEVLTGSLGELAARYASNEPKGEIVVIVGPPAEAGAEQGDYEAALREALSSMPVSKAAGSIAKRFGLDRSDVYARATQIKAEG